MSEREEIGLRAVLETEAWEAGSAAIAAGGQRISNAIDSTAASMGDASESFAAVDSDIKQTRVSLRDLGDEAKKTLSELQPLGIGLAGLGAAGGVLIGSSVMLAARVEELGIALERVGENAGYSRDELAEYEEGIMALGITTQVSRQALLQMTQAQIDLSHATDLARLSQDAAVIAQLDSSEAFQRLIYGIQSGQVEILRTMGLNVNFANSYKDMADSLGIAVTALDEQQKAQARVNAVMEAGEGIAGAYEAAMTTAGKNLRTVTGRLWEETRLAIGENYLPMMGKIVFVAKDILTAFNGLDPAQQRQVANWLAIGTAVTTATGGFVLLAPRIITTIEALGTAARVAKDAGVGLALYAEGASLAEVSSLGLGAALGAVVIPLTALAAAGGLFAIAVVKSREITEALEEQEAQLRETAGTYEKYADGLVLAYLEAGRYHMQIVRMQAAGLSNAEIVERLIHLTGDLTEAEWEAERATRETTEATGDLTEAELEAERTTRDWTSAIEETRDRLIAVADAQEDLNLQLSAMQDAIKITEALDEYATNMGDIRREIADVREELERTPLAYYVEEQALSTDELTIAQYRAVQASDRLTAAQQALAENTDPDRQLELQAAVAQTSIALEGAGEALQGTAGGWASNADAVGELREKLEELRQKQMEVKATFDESIQGIMMDIMMARLATDGWTEAEIELAYTIQRDMGLITDSAYDTAMAMNDAMTGFADGTGIAETEAAFANMYWQLTGNIPEGFQVMVDTATGQMSLVSSAFLGTLGPVETARLKMADYTREIEGIPTGVDTYLTGNWGEAIGNAETLADRINRVPRHVRIEFETVYTGPSPSQIPGTQAGGPVEAGYPRWVGEAGPEIFVPERSGVIIPNDQAAGGIGNTYITNEGDTYNLNLATVAGEEAVEMGFHVLRTMG